MPLFEEIERTERRARSRPSNISRSLSGLGGRLALFGAVFSLSALLCGAPPSRNLPVIIDTDAGSDDLLAIAFLLAQKDVSIEAITVANGLAHVDAGARNVARLVAAAGRKGIPVLAGRPTPLKGTAGFPAEWRRFSDDLAGVELPPLAQQLPAEKAADFLARRLRQRDRPLRILALGPLTNVAEALRKEPEGVRTIQDIVIMGGAVNVPGNLSDGGVFKTENRTAEWNIFVDPFAAGLVFASGARITLVPLDATNKVAIDPAFMATMKKQAVKPLGRVVVQMLERVRSYVESGLYYAWDPLAAVTLLDPRVAKVRLLAIEVRQEPPEEGRTVAVVHRAPNAQVAYDADSAAFRRIFVAAFRK